jgi:hypothetical protein
MDWTTGEGPVAAGVRRATSEHSRGRVDLEIRPDEPRIVRFSLTTFAEIEEARRRLAMSSGPCTQVVVQEPVPKPKRRRKAAAVPGKTRRQA